MKCLLAVRISKHEQMTIFTITNHKLGLCIASTTLQDIAPTLNKTANALRIAFSRVGSDYLIYGDYMVSRTELQRIKGRGNIRT